MRLVAVAFVAGMKQQSCTRLYANIAHRQEHRAGGLTMTGDPE